jgi:hypothetical protein
MTTEKTRKVNVIAYYDKQWRVAVNLPDVPLDIMTVSVLEAEKVAQFLLGEISYKQVGGGGKIYNVASYIRRNVADDLIEAVAKEVKNIAAMAEYYQGMADLADKNPAGTPPAYPGEKEKTEYLQ